MVGVSSDSCRIDRASCGAILDQESSMIIVRNCFARRFGLGALTLGVGDGDDDAGGSRSAGGSEMFADIAAAASDFKKPRP